MYTRNPYQHHHTAAEAAGDINTMNREVDQQQVSNDVEAYEPEVTDAGRLRNDLASRNVPHLVMRMEDEEFAEFIVREAEKLPREQFEAFFTQVEHSSRLWNADRNLSPPPPAPGAVPNSFSTLQISRKRKATDDRDEHETRDMKRQAVLAIPAPSQAFQARQAVPVTRAQDTVNPQGADNSQQSAPSQATPEVLSNGIPRPPPLPAFRPRANLLFMRIVSLNSGANIAPVISGPIDIWERYNVWEPRNRTRGFMAFAYPPGRIRIMAQEHLEGRLPESSFGVYRNPLISRCTPDCVDIRFLGNVRITVEEILSFFPLHTLWREIILRLCGNGWSAAQIVEFIYRSRKLRDINCIQRTTVQHQKQAAARWRTNSRTNNPTPYTLGGIDTARGSHLTNQALIDYFLVDLANGIRRNRFPSGQGEGALTRAIKHALLHKHIWVKLSEVDQYIQDYGLDHNLPTINAQQDLDAVTRSRAKDNRNWKKHFGMHR